jgi:sortase A
MDARPSPPDRPGNVPPMHLAKVLSAIGRSCITVGTLLLLFVAYQLWGTGIREAQAQDKLSKKFDKVLAEAPEYAPGEAPPIDPVPEGEPTAIIRIPKIGVDKNVVEGVGVGDLKKGPGHYPETPLPGQKGNAAIAGHRTTYGAPFNRVDELEPGDEIIVETVQGTFRYEVIDEDGDGDGHTIVTPSQVEVLEDKGDNRLTLTACHPKLSARQRIVIFAKLAGDQVALAAQVSGQPSSLDDISGETSSRVPAVVLFILCGAIWVFAYCFSKLWQKWPAYAVCLPFFMVGLFFFFEEFSRMLPSNF